jgi:hypothetical protein
MATVGGNQPPFRGRIGGIVYYYLNGVLVARTIGVNDGPPSVLQQAGRVATKIVANFLNPLKSFIKVGYELDAKINKSQAYNQAYSYLRKNAIKGTYPDLELDYGKVLLTWGGMPLPPNPRVAVTDRGLTFTWDIAGEVAGTHWTDQVMVVAYFPERNSAFYLTGGARRDAGAEFLPLDGMIRGQVVETYFSFIADDRSSIATSVYTGRLLW